MNVPMVREDAAIMPQSFEGMLAQADVLVKSGLLPVEIKTPAAAVAIMLTGRELEIPPMQALRSIFVVKGKPSLSAQLMAALILRAGHGYKIIESSNVRCEIEFTRRNGQTYRHEFTMEDAKRAGLANSGTWQSYPKALLFSRCMSAGARVFMPDVLAGMYTPEELADPDTVIVDDTGEIIDVKPKPVTPPEPERAALPEPARPERVAGQARGWASWSERARAAFWAKARDLRLSNDVIHEGFGVETMTGFDRGTMDEANILMLAIDYAVNKTTLTVAGLNEALGANIVDRVCAEAWTFEAIKNAVDIYIDAKVKGGADIKRQEALAI